jgi:hypothetical protein
MVSPFGWFTFTPSPFFTYIILACHITHIITLLTQGFLVNPIALHTLANRLPRIFCCRARIIKSIRKFIVEYQGTKHHYFKSFDRHKGKAKMIEMDEIQLL